MILFALIVAAAACVAVAWMTGAVVFAYVALGLCALGLVALAVHVWRSRRSGSAAVGRTETADSPSPDAAGSESTQAESTDAESADAETAEEETTSPGSVVAVHAVDEAGPDSTDAPTDLVVHVIPGRKRFHRSGCRLLAEHDHEELTVVEAIEEGFTSCSVCVGSAGRSQAVKAG